jgi:hypothetical protein
VDHLHPSSFSLSWELLPSCLHWASVFSTCVLPIRECICDLFAWFQYPGWFRIFTDSASLKYIKASYTPNCICSIWQW